LSNVKTIVEVLLFPGIVTVVGGVLVILPVLLLAVQVTPARLMLCRDKGLLAGPPVREFQVAWTLSTVIASCGLVMVMLIIGVPPGILMAVVVIMLQPGTGVEVMVGVKVIVGVNVIVGVKVIVAVGVMVGVLDGGIGVKVDTPGGSVAVGATVLVAKRTVAVGELTGTVAVNVLEGTAVFGAVVEVGTDPTGAPPEPENVPESTSR
jgi:hypothetical protein